MTFPKMNLIEKILIFSLFFYLQNAYLKKMETYLENKIKNNVGSKSRATSQDVRRTELG